jgi:hypothetical protein
MIKIFNLGNWRSKPLVEGSMKGNINRSKQERTIAPPPPRMSVESFVGLDSKTQKEIIRRAHGK